MRKIMVTAMILGLASVSTSWALLGLEDISYDGSIEFNGASAKNETDLNDAKTDTRGNTTTRVRVGINATVTESVKGRVEFMRPGGTRLLGSADTTIAGEEATIQISNAFIDYEDLFGLDLIRLGRQYIGEAGDLVWNISPTDDDSLPTASIDGLLLKNAWLDNMLGVELFTGKAAEDDTVANTDAGDVTGDINLSAVHVNFNVIPGGRVRLGFLHGIDHNATLLVAPNTQAGDNNMLSIYRVGVNGEVYDGFLTYRAEFLQNDGSFNGAGKAGTSPDLDYGGNAFDIGGGVNLKETGIGSFNLGASFVWASGDDNTTDNNDDSFHDFGVMGVGTSDRLYGEILGKSNTLGGTVGLPGPVALGVNTRDLTGTATAGTSGPGIQIVHVSAGYSPSWWEKGWGRFDFYNAQTTEDSVQTAAGTSVNIDGSIGNEVDFTVGYDQSENVTLEFGYATLFVGDYLVGVQNGFGPPIAGADDSVNKLFFRSKVKWGGGEE